MAQIVEAEYPYKYTNDDGSVVSFNRGDRFILLAKSSDDWWKVQRTGVFTGKSVCYVPCAYVKEVNISSSQNNLKQYGNQYVNMDVYQRIIAKDKDGLAKLGNKTMVMPNSTNFNNNINEQAKFGQNGNSLKHNEYDEDEEESGDDDAFSTSLDDIPVDIRAINLDNSSDMSPEDPPTSPLSFDVSPRHNDMKSFTLPSGWKKGKDQQSGRSFYFNEDSRQKTWKPPRLTASEANLPMLNVEKTTTTYDLPKGWIREFDTQSKSVVFVNTVNKEKWKSCEDKNGKTYYYNLSGNETAWSLPQTQINDKPKALRRRSFDETLDGIIRTRSLRSHSPQERNLRCQSYVVRSSSSLSSEEESNKSKSPVVSPRPSPRPVLPSNHERSVSNNSFEIIDADMSNLDNQEVEVSKPDIEGYLYRRKVYEGHKHVKKVTWQQVYCCKYGSSLVFYKDQKMAASKPGFPSGKPESSFHLLGAVLDHVSKDKAKGKKNVFQISSYGNQNVQQFVAESQVEMGAWITSIQTTIKRLEEEEPLPPPPPVFDLPNGGESLNSTPSTNDSPLLTPVSAGARPTTPTVPKKLLQPGGFKGFKRTFSKKVLNSNEEEKEKTKIRDKLKKYLAKRPSYSELEHQGIIKDFVFGCDITKHCEYEDTLVPKIIVQIANEVESRGLTTDGLYRVSGNLAAIQKLRVMVDHGEHVDFKLHEWDDVHLLTGALKLYFRELKEPLIPFNLYNSFINAIKTPFKAEKIKKTKALVQQMPRVNKETLDYLVSHLIRVMDQSSQNRMHSQNLAIVFGPTLMWPEEESLNMAMSTVYQNQVIEFLLLEYSHVFQEYV